MVLKSIKDSSYILSKSPSLKEKKTEDYVAITLMSLAPTIPMLVLLLSAWFLWSLSVVDLFRSSVLLVSSYRSAGWSIVCVNIPIWSVVASDTWWGVINLYSVAAFLLFVQRIWNNLLRSNRDNRNQVKTLVGN